MTIRISVGGELFDMIRKNKCYYVDKTELIYEYDVSLAKANNCLKFGVVTGCLRIAKEKKSESKAQMEKDCEEALKNGPGKKCFCSEYYYVDFGGGL